MNDNIASEPTCCTFCQSYYVAGTFPTQEEKSNPIKIDKNFDVTDIDVTDIDVTDIDMNTCENMCQAWNED